MTEQTITADAAVEQLIGEGYRRADVLAAIDSLISAGLEADQPDEGTVLTLEEVGVVRDQLGPAPKKTGRPSEGKLISLRVPAEHLAAGTDRAAQLGIDRSELFRRYIASGLAAGGNARYLLQLPTHHAAEIESYLRDTLRAADATGSVSRDGTVIEFDQDAHDYLASLPDDADGHIDDGDNLWIGGTDYQLGRI